MSDVKILVSCHKEVDLPESDIIQPIQVGAGIASTRFEGMLYDDVGNNITEKNSMYCELTAQYWAWKNLDVDYYGFFHYRRYMNFSKKSFREDAYGNIIDDYIDNEAVKKYSFNDKSIREQIDGYDIIITPRKDLRKMPGHFSSVRLQYENAKWLFEDDLQCVLNIIDEKYPEYSKYAKRYIEGHVTSFCNMYILRKEIFNAYCQWLFDILFEFERRTDMSKYSVESLRTPGHLSERLFGIFYLHLIDNNKNIKVKELQSVLFEYPERQNMLQPAFANKSIPIALAANDNFVPVLAVCLTSIIENSSIENNYDLVILESDIQSANKTILKSMIEGGNNFSLRFLNAKGLLSGYRLKANAHITVETFFRFLIQEILPGYDKVLYIDCDLVAETDVAELFATNLDGYYIGASLDPDFIGQINGANLQTKKYCTDVLKLNNPYAYFQAGVLLMNVREMRKAYSLDEWLTFASKDYKYSDQDVLNIYCQHKVKFIDMSWNMLFDCDHYRINYVIQYAPAYIHKMYLQARKNPKIIHFAGFLKPWHRPDQDFAERFWFYARKTPYYEQLIFKMNESLTWNVANGIFRSTNAKELLRNMADKFFPKGTERRDWLKRVVPLCWR